MTTPLGLAMMTPMGDRPAVPSELSGAMLDPDTQLGMLDGVALHSHAVALVVGSTQTNPDGQDPIAVDTEPTYDVA